MKQRLIIEVMGIVAVFAVQAHAQLLVVNPTKMNADWETGHWTSGYAEFSELRANFEVRPGSLSESYADRREWLTFYATNEFARSGDYSVKFYSEPQPTDPQPYRTEIACFGGLTYNVGDELYYSASFRPGADWATGSLPANWTSVIIQWKIAGAGIPPFGLHLSNDGKHIVDTGDASLGELPVDEWTDFVFFFKWSHGNDGIIRIWKNGELVYEFYGQTWIYDPNTYQMGYLQFGEYTQLQHAPRTMYVDNVRIGDSVFTNQLPAFVTDPISSPKAKAGWAYSGSISGSATDPEGSPPTYAKVAGPAWLQVAADGTLSGTPGPGDIGPNVFTVRAADNDFGEDTATLNINVSSSHPITVATDDFESNSWSGGTGWSDDWAVTTGSTAPAIVLTSGNYSVRLRDGANNHSITRTLGSPISDGTLKFKWDVDHLDSPSEYAYAEVFDGSWHTVWSMNSGGNGGDGVPTPDNLQEASVDLSAYGAVTQLRFSMSSNTSGSDYFFIDDIELRIYVDAYYEAWRNSFSLSDEDAALLGDPDLDGLDNLGEYGLGGYPDQAGLPAGILPVIQVDSGGSGAVNMIYRRRRDAAARGLSYYLDLTGNLDGGPWSTGGYTETGTQVLDADFESVTNEVPVGVSNEFIRLNIQLD